MAHAFLITGDALEGGREAARLACEVVGTSDATHPDILMCTYDLLSVDDAREIARLAANAPVAGERKAFVIQAARLFHEAQNALLKLFEEPPAGTVLYLVLPHAGGLLPTLRSRLIVHALQQTSADNARAFADASLKEREQIITKLVERARSEKDESQAVRAEVEAFLAGLVRLVHQMPRTQATVAFLDDATHLAPILATRSAPLRQILEHVLLTFPK